MIYSFYYYYFFLFTGRCICEDNTDGANCETCARGFYGNAMQGSEKDCQPCPCPNQGACIVLPDESIACLECPEGYAGKIFFINGNKIWF